MDTESLVKARIQKCLADVMVLIFAEYSNLFETRNDYFYSSYDTHGGKVITPKLPFNSQLKLYKLSWSNPKHTKGTDSIIAYRENIKRYLDSLGYNSVDRIYEPNKSKAIKLERELKNSKYHI